MHPSFFKRPLFLFLVIFCVFLSVFLDIPKPKSKDIYNFSPAEKIEVQGKVVSFPRVKGDRQMFVMHTSKAGGKRVKSNLQVYCHECPRVSKGQKIVISGSLKDIASNENFGSFNWKEYQARRHIFAELSSDNEVKIKRGSFFWAIISSIRNSMLDVFNNNFDSPLNIILSGIVLGEKGDVPYSVYTAFQDSGAMHLLVASGSNVGFVTLIIYFLCSLIGFGRLSSAMAAVFFAGFYTLVAGADPPLVRAFLMTFCGTIGFLLGRKSGVLQGFILAAVGILIFSPQSFFDVGFRMSFLATLALILLVINFKIPAKWPRYVKAVSGLFLISLAAQLALVPIFTNYFHKISFSAVFSNLLLVPLSGVIMGGGFIIWLGSFFAFDFIFQMLRFMMEVLLVVFNFLVNFFASLPISRLVTPSWNTATVVGYYILFITVMLFPVLYKKKIRVIIPVAVSLVFFISGIIMWGKPQTHILYGRYNMSVLINDGKTVKVIGAGVEGDIIAKALLASGKKKIDCMFLSSNSKSGGYALNRLEDIKITNIYLPYGEIPNPLEDLLSLKEDAKVSFMWEGEQDCSVTALKPWFISREGETYEKQADGVLSYLAGYISTAGNLKAIKKAGTLYEMPAS